MIPRNEWESLICDTITELTAGLTAIGLYGSDHPRARQSVERLVGQLAVLLAEERELVFVLLGDELFVQDRPFSRSSRQAPSLIRRLRRRNLEHLAFRSGLGDEELRSFLDDMARAEDVPVRSRPHIQVGRVELGASEVSTEEPESPGPADRHMPNVRDRVTVIHEAFRAAHAGNELPVSDLEHVVLALLDGLGRDPDPISLFAPWEGDERWPAVHAHNVCALTLGMSRLSGIATSWSVELGMAAMLHDIGKLSLPAEVQSRELELTGDELELLLDHHKLGFELLLANRQIGPLSLVVAFEHHIGYNGGGSPRLTRPRRPHPATRMVAVADAFVVLHTLRGSRGLASRETTIAWLNQHSGTLLDPGWTGVVEDIVGLTAQAALA